MSDYWPNNGSDEFEISDVGYISGVIPESWLMRKLRLRKHISEMHSCSPPQRRFSFLDIVLVYQNRFIVFIFYVPRYFNSKSKMSKCLIVQ